MYIIALLFLFISNSYAGIGTVVDATGTNCTIERSSKKISGEKGAIVESMDTYITGSCVSNITFDDGTKVKVNENSKLFIDEFVYDPKQSDAGKLAIKVGMGTVRYASGQIAKNNPQKVDIKTPTAAVAVRGTDFTMTVDEIGQSLVVLVPSCKDEKDVKKYELQENTCQVGRIIVSNGMGSVELSEAYQATFVNSNVVQPTPPVVINMTEGQIGNNLIILKPAEIQKAVKENTRTQKDSENDAAEDETARRSTSMALKSAELNDAKISSSKKLQIDKSCNPSSSVCVAWENKDAEGQAKGIGVAYRFQPDEHYTEIKTQGYTSNTSISITQNDEFASTVIGDGAAGGNIITIKQQNGVLNK
jgi:hypothetical protein